MHPDRVRLPDIKESETMQQRRISTHMYMLDQTKMPKRSFPLFEDDTDGSYESSHCICFKKESR